MEANARIVEVIDLDTGNIGSVLKMLLRIGCTPRVVKEPNQLLGGCPVLLPGVGHFSKAVTSLEQSGLRKILDALYEKSWPVLGICIGAQLMCNESEEGPGKGLGWIPTTVRRFPPIDIYGKILRVPHMGWQPFTPPDGILPFTVPVGRMYFAHSFFIDPTSLVAESVCESSWGYSVCKCFTIKECNWSTVSSRKKPSLWNDIFIELDPLGNIRGKKFMTKTFIQPLGKPTPRIIVALTMLNGRLVRTIKFKNPNYVGDPIVAVKIFNDKCTDELILFEIGDKN